MAGTCPSAELSSLSSYETGERGDGCWGESRGVVRGWFRAAPGSSSPVSRMNHEVTAQQPPRPPDLCEDDQSIGRQEPDPHDLALSQLPGCDTMGREPRVSCAIMWGWDKGGGGCILIHDSQADPWGYNWNKRHSVENRGK